MMPQLKQPLELKVAWNELRVAQPQLRIRNAAEELGVSEAALVALQCGEKAIRLRPEMREILGRVHELGYVMGLTRNDQVVHERKGVYENGRLSHPAMGLFVNEDIDLRIFWGPWKHAFAVTSQARGKTLHSLQFFDEAGTALHKIYLTPKSDHAAYQQLVEDFKSEEQGLDFPAVVLPETTPELPDGDIEVDSFQKGWRELKDTHDFFGLLKSHKLTRTQALRLAPGPEYAVEVEPKSVRRVLEKASENNIPIMVFVGNRGMIQIHTGPVKKLMDYGTWVNVMDPAFNLHLNEAGIAQTWIVRKPTEDGVVTSLEVFDEKGEMMVQMFGKRKPGIPEMASWQELVREVHIESQHA